MQPNALHQSASLAVSNPNHSIGFGYSAVASPGSLSYNFGMSAASSFGVPTTPWRSHPSTTNNSPRFSPLATHSATPMGQSRRRRRDSSPSLEAEVREQTGAGAGEGMETGSTKVMRNLKKARMGGEDVRSNETEAAKQTVDLGKSLASLSKESLLTLLTSLVTTHPTLRPLVTSLLPQPTLATILSSINDLERIVMSSIPSGAGIREDYIWGRTKPSLENYVAEATTFLTIVCSPGANAGPGGGAGGEDEIGHPSTTFAFLHALTSSLRRIEAVLPSPLAASNDGTNRNRQDPLATHLLPLLFNFWHLFVTRLSAAVNQEGRIISAGVLRGWLSRIDELCVASPGVDRGGRREGGAKKACEGVRDRMRREVGWLVGIKIDHSMRMNDEDEL